DKAEMKKPPDGVIRFEVYKVSALDGIGNFSEEIDVRGVPWMINVYKDYDFYYDEDSEDNDDYDEEEGIDDEEDEEYEDMDVDEDDDEKFLIVSLDCLTNQPKKWSIEMDVEFTLIHPDKNEHLTEMVSDILNQEYCIGSNLLDWKQLNGNKQGFIKDDKIIVEVRFWISSMMGIKIIPRLDFTDPNEPRHDIVLVIEGEKIYVNKAYLSIHSPVFNAMFYGGFAESNKGEIELKDIDRKEFLGLLNVLTYPSYTRITDANAVYLLKLANQYQISAIVERIEAFLIDKSSLSVSDKLRIADQYKLIDLQENCLNSFETIKDIKMIKNTEGYKSLSNDVKSALMDRVMNLKYR
ncbi:hypothetical protein PMAYCL1PPCAC_24914, partial [Pristionchus mayeri]